MDQDPVALGPEVVESSRQALRLRYSLLPYLYTLFVRAHLNGTPVARPIFFEFPYDSNTYNLGERQFMWGSSLMIAPVVDEVGRKEARKALQKSRGRCHKHLR